MEQRILEWSIRAVLMAIGTGLVMRGLRIDAATIRHRAWALAMATMLLLPLWTNWGPSFTAPVLPAVSDAQPVPVIRRPLAIVSRLPAPQPVPAMPFESAPAERPIDWQQILLGIYLAGAGVMLARLIAGTMRIRALLRHARPSDGFVTTALCAAPVTVGWLRPILLLPDSWRTWPAAKLEAVLIHEREHIRRRDPLVQWLALLNRCVFWFHPLAWWLERKLAALAEEACDTAVLARGYAAADYSRYLIELARSINERGARIRWAGAAAFSEGKLPERIRRIMDAPSGVAMSRSKSVASVGLCALLLATALACNLGRQAARAQGQLTMAQQEQRDRNMLLQDRQQRQRQGENAALWSSVLNVSPDGAKVLLYHVRADPGDQDNLQELIRYYQAKKDLKSLDALTLWIIGQHPDMRVNWAYRPVWDMVWDQDGYRRAKELWTAQLKQAQLNQSASPYIYMNAAEYMAGTDNEQAEQILLEGRRRFPATGQYSGLHWEMLLAHLYEQALAGPGGPFAQKVRATLMASNDVELIDRTVERLQGDAPELEFARALNARVLSTHPDDREAILQASGLRLLALAERAKANPGSLNDTDRMALLCSQLNPRRRESKDAESKARELLALAGRFPKDPDYGTAIFVANIALGEAALSRGDKSEAARLLLVAADAPATAYLRSVQVDMALPRKLVDAGERETVAKFLDRCAKFDGANRRLAEWAAQIRMGMNPDLRPNSDVFRKAG